VTETEQTFESNTATTQRVDGPVVDGSALDRTAVDGVAVTNGRPSGGLNGAALGRPAASLNGGRAASTADLVKLASEQITQLVRDEVALARIEMTNKAKRMGVGAGLFGGAGIVVVYGVGALIAGLALLLALVLPNWAAALIVAGGLFLLAAILSLIGRAEVKRAGTPMPDEAIGGLKADVQALSQAVKEGRT
jgi:Putative Actinobacterial Holin-X, holin superfamily III